MTLEEIEARWKAATPGPWRGSTDPIPRIDDARNNPVYWCDSYESYPICADDLHAIAAAPTDIAYLLDRVRKLERAHAWFVEHNATNDSSFGCEVCLGPGEDDDTLGHTNGCEWVKARELRL